MMEQERKGQIFVRAVKGNTVTVDLFEESSGVSVLEALRIADGTPPDQIRLTFAGKQLESTAKLVAVGVKPGDSIVATSRLRGGGALTTEDIDQISKMFQCQMNHFEDRLRNTWMRELDERVGNSVQLHLADLETRLEERLAARLEARVDRKWEETSTSACSTSGASSSGDGGKKRRTDEAQNRQSYNNNSNDKDNFTDPTKLFISGFAKELTSSALNNAAQALLAAIGYVGDVTFTSRGGTKSASFKVISDLDATKVMELFRAHSDPIVWKGITLRLSRDRSPAERARGRQYNCIWRATEERLAMLKITGIMLNTSGPKGILYGSTAASDETLALWRLVDGDFFPEDGWLTLQVAESEVQAMRAAASQAFAAPSRG